MLRHAENRERSNAIDHGRSKHGAFRRPDASRTRVNFLTLFLMLTQAVRGFGNVRVPRHAVVKYCRIWRHARIPMLAPLHRSIA